MNKADYIHLFKEACGGRCNAEYNPCAYRQAADSLAALEPVAFSYVSNFYKTDGETLFVNSPDKILRAKNLKYAFTPLYALEANNEDAPLP